MRCWPLFLLIDLVMRGVAAWRFAAMEMRLECRPRAQCASAGRRAPCNTCRATM